MERESGKERFKRVAEKRVRNILKSLRSLSQCANQNVYAWTDKQLDKIWKAIDQELTSCKECFSDPDGSVFKL